MHARIAGQDRTGRQSKLTMFSVSSLSSDRNLCLIFVHMSSSVFLEITTLYGLQEKEFHLKTEVLLYLCRHT